MTDKAPNATPKVAVSADKPLQRHARTCAGKTRYSKRTDAKQTANKIRTTGGPAMQPYQCTACGFWHIGHSQGNGTGLRRIDHTRETRAREEVRIPRQRDQEQVVAKLPDFNGRQACLNDEAFNDGRASEAKRATCGRCPCLPECFAWSIQFEPFGFWAGMSATERKKIRDKYAIRAAFDNNGAPRTMETA